MPRQARAVEHQYGCMLRVQSITVLLGGPRTSFRTVSNVSYGWTVYLDSGRPVKDAQLGHGSPSPRRSR